MMTAQWQYHDDNDDGDDDDDDRSGNSDNIVNETVTRGDVGHGAVTPLLDGQREHESTTSNGDGQRPPGHCMFAFEEK